MNKLRCAAMAAVVLLSATPTLAATLSILPVQSVVAVGETFQVQLAAELAANEFMSLPEIDVSFDHALLGFAPETGLVINDSWGASTFESVIYEQKPANLAIYTPDDLDLSWQHAPGGFVIGTLTFTALAPGKSDLLFGYVGFYNGQLPVDRETIILNTAHVQVQAVPIPGAALLLGSALIGLAVLRRKS